jgi:hypothetical protein
LRASNASSAAMRGRCGECDTQAEHKPTKIHKYTIWDPYLFTIDLKEPT